MGESCRPATRRRATLLMRDHRSPAGDVRAAVQRRVARVEAQFLGAGQICRPATRQRGGTLHDQLRARATRAVASFTSVISAECGNFTYEISQLRSSGFGVCPSSSGTSRVCRAEWRPFGSPESRTSLSLFLWRDLDTDAKRGLRGDGAPRFHEGQSSRGLVFPERIRRLARLRRWYSAVAS